MWLSYLKVAFRSLIKQRLYAFINIAGLAIGVTTCILILMYVRYEKATILLTHKPVKFKDWVWLENWVIMPFV